MSSWKAQAVAITPKISGCLSLASSSLIVFNIISLPLIKRQQVYTRLILAISIFDVLSSLAFLLSTWPIPADSGISNASGTQATCTTQGFFVQLSLTVPFLNTSLAIYYWAVLCLKWNDKKIRQHLESLLMSIPMIVASILAFVGLYMKLYSNANVWCWVASVPSNCGGDTGVKCERGEHAKIFRWAGFYGPLWGCIMFVTILMIFVLINVWKMEKESAMLRIQQSSRSMERSTSSADDNSLSFSEEDKQEGDDHDDDDDDDDDTDSIYDDQQQSARTSTVIKANNTRGNISSTNHKEKTMFANDSTAKTYEKSQSLHLIFVNRKNKKRGGDDSSQDIQLKLRLTRKVFWQSIFYVLAFYLSWIFPTTLRLLQAFDKPVPFAISMLTVIFLPLQGFFNAFIYFRPRLIYWMKQRKEQAEKRNQANNRVFTVTVKSLAIGNIGEQHLTNDQVGNLEMESNPAYALSLATSKTPNRRLVGYKQHAIRPAPAPPDVNNDDEEEDDAYSEPLNDVDVKKETNESSARKSATSISLGKKSDSSCLSTTFKSNEDQTPTTTAQKGLPWEHESRQDLVQELKANSFIRIKGTMMKGTSDVYDELFDNKVQPEFDAIYQLPLPQNARKPSKGFSLYGDMCHIFDVSCKSSEIWNDEENEACRNRIEYELDGLTTILIVDLRGHTAQGQQQWEEFMEPLVLTGDVKVIALIH